MNLYRNEIIEHYKDPLNFGLLTYPTYSRHEVNPTCGDDFTFTIHLTTQGVIDAVGFSGQGCAISTASASLLSEAIKGKPLAEVLELKSKFVLDLLGIDLGPTRLKCALLPLQAITRITSPEPSSY